MKLYLILGVVLLAFSCKPENPAADMQQLLQLHGQQQTAHLTKNARLLVDQSAENFISVNRGKIDSVFSREEDIARFQQYFDAVEFRKWDDVTAPKIRFSEDHSLAYMIVDKSVVLETTNDDSKRIVESTHFAWVTIFRKTKSGWKIECIVSTNEPESIELL